MCSAGRLAGPRGAAGGPGRPRRASERPGRDLARARSWLLTWILAHLTGYAIVLAGYNNGGSNQLTGDWQHTTEAAQEAPPYFDTLAPRNVTALVGKTAYLSCRVHNLGNKTVSWIRHRDLHILTVGSYSYTSDERFQASHLRDRNDWLLHIKWAQQRDAGMYECQVPTQPVKSYFVYLNVVGRDPLRRPPPAATPRPQGSLLDHTMYSDQVPTAIILGAPDLHVDKGSTINITCTVRFSPEPPSYIFWYHKEEVISYDSERGGVSIITEKGDVTTSRLLVQNADLPDSGKYSCSPSNAEFASIRVHVLNGEMPAAMQTGSAGQSSSIRHIVELLALLAVYSRFSQNLHLAR